MACQSQPQLQARWAAQYTAKRAVKRSAQTDERQVGSPPDHMAITPAVDQPVIFLALFDSLMRGIMPRPNPSSALFCALLAARIGVL
ncbi:hypothetical protein CW360_12645 [Pseudomonas fluvialis]|uniref:Uncharacterized protein n=1 Tax=Pseudomonas fluvialis TaxID=1793966 RepID=A0A2I0CNC7_9PSED|nr:hypothetical protein CW360_12645 [Pseudomonas pharmacofabricae]